MTERKIYDPIQTLPDTKMRFNIAKAKANVKVQDDFVNQLLDIADAASEALAALHGFDEYDGIIPEAIWNMRCEAVAKLEKVMK